MRWSRRRSRSSPRGPTVARIRPSSDSAVTRSSGSWRCMSSLPDRSRGDWPYTSSRRARSAWLASRSAMSAMVVLPQQSDPSIVVTLPGGATRRGPVVSARNHVASTGGLMITREDVEEIAAGWARGESERRGYECTPVISEFDLGFVVWTKQPPTVLPIPGDGARTVIDRATGALSTYPGVPANVIADLYRTHQPAVAARRRTVDPEVELRRNARRRPAPTTAAHLTLDGHLFIARGAKGDQQIDHHPLVAAQLAALPPAETVRGTERHAELIVLS